VKIFARDVFVDKKELIKFWKLSASASISMWIFWRILRHCEVEHCPINWKKLIGSSWKFCHRCVFGRISPHYILEVIRVQIRTWFALAEVCIHREASAYVVDWFCSYRNGKLAFSNDVSFTFTCCGIHDARVDRVAVRLLV